MPTKTFRFLFLCLCAVGVLGVSMVGTSYAKDYTREVEFDRTHNDKGALFKAKELFRNYLSQYNIRFEEVESYAQYVDLGPGSSKKYIAYHRKDGGYGECALAGCTVIIFENFEDNRWRIILHISTHGLYIADRAKTNGLSDIYLVAGESTNKIKWVFNGVKYVKATVPVENKEEE